jgi:hypothetical protein
MTERISDDTETTVVRRVTYGLAALAALAAFGCGENLTPVAEREAYEPAEIEPLECFPNLDSTIVADELPIAEGVAARYLVTPAGATRPVDLRGLVNASGQRRWDWSAPSPEDRLAELSADPLGAQWFADEFPGGRFVSPVELGGRIMGVYSQSSEAILLHGLASVAEEPRSERTLFVYDDPVAVYRFPLEVGRQWVSVGTVQDGTFRGLPYAGRDTYEISVEGDGELLLPDLSFEQVLQVYTKVTVQPAVGTSTVTRQVSFVYECFGEVARATSREGEEEKFFDVAAEVRRLGISSETSL